MHYGEFANYLQYFADALTSGADHSPDLTEGIETFCLMEAVRRSALTGGAPVEVAELWEQVSR